MWNCARCSEQNEDNFELCWSCQHDRLGPQPVQEKEDASSPKIITLFMRTQALVPRGNRVCVRYATVNTPTRHHASAIERCRLWPWVEDLTSGITYAPRWAVGVRLEMEKGLSQPDTLPMIAHIPTALPHSALPIIAHGPTPIFKECYRLDGVVESVHNIADDGAGPTALLLGKGNQFTLMKLRLVEGHQADRRERIDVRQADLYLDEGGLEQIWPTGAVHHIRWSSPFECLLHRGPDATNQHTPVHMKLVQRDESGQTEAISLTLLLATTQAMQNLPVLDERLPVIRGQVAERLLSTVRRCGASNGLRLPI